MKSFKTIAATLLACATIQAASAGIVIVSVTPDSSGPAIPAITFEGLAPLPAAPGNIGLGLGATLSYNNAVIVQSDSNADGAAPFPSAPGNEYLAVKAGGVATLSFDQLWDELGFQWGSVDDYNEIKFFNGLNLVDTFTGLDVIFPADGEQGPGGSAYVVFGGAKFDRVELRSFNKNSFEIDNIAVSVPDAGSSLALLGLAFLALAGVARRRSA